MVKSVEDLLSDREKGRTRASGILCWMFRDVLVQRQVNLFTWRKRIKLYFEKPHNQYVPGQRGRKPDRGNLNKDLIKDDFTWGNFKKAIDFLDPKSATLSVELTWHDDRVTLHHIKIDPAEDESDTKLNEFGNIEHHSELFCDRHRSQSTLARLFRRIVTEERITPKQWDGMLKAYIRNPHNGYQQKSQLLTTQQSSLQKELMDVRMTWSVFRKSMLVLQPKNVRYILELKWMREGSRPTFASVTDRVI